jgi:hypothetical protein
VALDRRNAALREVMRKELLRNPEGLTGEQPWLSTIDSALVSITSEDPAYPIENALSPPFARGWRAGAAGLQTIRLTFSGPIRLQRVRLRFRETVATRTQEFVLRCGARCDDLHQVIRQQWNFSPAGSTCEIEDYALNCEGINVVELEIVPDLTNHSAVATMQEFRLG